MTAGCTCCCQLPCCGTASQAHALPKTSVRHKRLNAWTRLQFLRCEGALGATSLLDAVHRQMQGARPDLHASRAAGAQQQTTKSALVVTLVEKKLPGKTSEKNKIFSICNHAQEHMLSLLMLQSDKSEDTNKCSYHINCINLYKRKSSV